jgi:hypothetical protein
MRRNGHQIEVAKEVIGLASGARQSIRDGRPAPWGVSP